MIGKTFEKAGVIWTVLEQVEGGYLCLAESIGNKQFTDNTNNYAESEIRKYLNGEFLERLTAEVGEANIILMKRDLTALDGLKEYGACEDKVSLISQDEYRKYREIIPNADGWWWTVTPWSTKSNGWQYSVTIVTPDGHVDYDGCSNHNGVRPICIFSSVIFE